ncbi:hypothetical protein AB0H42_02815 [Nocardia sp. NPDC050799]|uniref:hypothetical protein n=1 Tax=Nocardia sp. NPDC050799 TaxID=3154842 RepID=UPI00340B333E
MTEDRGAVFDGAKIGRPATGALIGAGYRTIDDLPERLDELLPLHGVGPRAIALLTATRRAGRCGRVTGVRTARVRVLPPGVVVCSGRWVPAAVADRAEAIYSDSRGRRSRAAAPIQLVRR